MLNFDAWMLKACWMCWMNLVECDLGWDKCIELFVGGVEDMDVLCKIRSCSDFLVFNEFYEKIGVEYGKLVFRWIKVEIRSFDLI